eukprot:CAMPEP_0170089870 /NCGR_PEP_ID=MMETSP0019_2-20121128/23821_1 /TAXON_ID=98059 /ORGANISM="Dinobryon sp., Strain UTEXLB2267" /LENGTH=39 /DNA_ID= /DNA_START= /DNA_END= /DNA_ORIENTATION=
MEVTEAGIEMEVRAVLKNELSPMEITEVGMLMAESAEQE